MSAVSRQRARTTTEQFEHWQTVLMWAGRAQILASVALVVVVIWKHT